MGVRGLSWSFWASACVAVLLLLAAPAHSVDPMLLRTPEDNKRIEVLKMEMFSQPGELRQDWAQKKYQIALGLVNQGTFEPAEEYERIHNPIHGCTISATHNTCVV